MNTKEQNTDTTGKTVAELEAALKLAKQKEKAEKEAARTEYETEKDTLIKVIGVAAISVHEELVQLKENTFKSMDDFREKMLKYGQIKGGENNKGNFEIKNDAFKIVFKSQVVKGFDERSELAEKHLKEFLSTFVKKRDKELHELILSLLERNSKTGDLDISNIQRLYAMEDKFDDENWKKAIALFKESFVANKTTRYITIYTRNANDGWDLLNLNFASV